MVAIAQESSTFDTEWRLAKAAALAGGGRFLEAASHLEAVLPGDSLYQEARHQLAQALLKAGHYERAAQIARDNLSQATDPSPDLYQTLGQALYQAGDAIQAGVVFRQAVEIFPYRTDFAYLSAWVHQQMGAWQTATAALQHYIELSYSDAEPHLALGRSLQATNRGTAALFAFGMAVVLAPDSLVAWQARQLIRQLIADYYSPRVEPSVDIEDAPLLAVDRRIRRQLADVKSRATYRDTLQSLWRAVVDALPPRASGLNFWMRNYAPFYHRLHQSDYLESFLRQLQRNPNNTQPTEPLSQRHQRAQKRFEHMLASFVEHRNRLFFDQSPEGYHEAPLWLDSKARPIAWGISAHPDTLAPDGFWRYPDTFGRLQRQGTYSNGQKHGRWQWFYPQGALRQQAQYHQGALHDTLWAYYPDGQIRQQIPYVQNHKHGQSKQYYPFGALAATEDWVEGRLHGRMRQYYPNGHVRAQVPFRQGKAHGIASTYFESGQTQNIETYADDLLHGPTRQFYIDSTVQMSGSYTYDQKSGSWQWFYPGGQLMSQIQFGPEQQREGASQSYFANGAIDEQRFYVHGVLQGTVHGFYPNGAPRYRYTYHKGQLHSYINLDLRGDTLEADTVRQGKLEVVTRHLDGSIEARGEFLNGEKQGLWTYFYTNAKLSHLLHFDNGLKTGEAKWYYPDGKPKRVLYYQADKEQGEWHSYYRNDSLAEHGFYDNGRPSGTWRRFFPNGKPQSTEQYAQGLLDGYQYYYQPDGVVRTRKLYTQGALVSIDDFDLQDGQACQRQVSITDSVYTSYFHTGHKRFEAQHQAGQLVGAYRRYYPSGALAEEGNLIASALHGTVRRYYPDSTLQAIEHYRNAQRVGLWQAFGPTGQRTAEWAYTADTITELRYNEQGREIERTQWYHDQPDGYQWVYNPYGALVCRKKFRQGVLVSYAYPYGAGGFSEEIPINYDSNQLKVYYKNGKLALHEHFDDGYLAGVARLYYPSGQLARETSYQHGLRHGTQRQFSAQGMLREEKNYFYDMLHGVCRQFDRLGQPVCTEHYLLGMLHGTRQCYDKASKLHTQQYAYGEWIE